MNLEAVARALGAQLPDGAGIPITDLAYDSRTVTPGTLFFCVRGRTQDGHAHAARAVEAGAAALVVEEPVTLPGRRVPQLVVPNSRAAMGLLAAPFFGDPSRTVAVAGVTGTNGKTTTTYLLESIFRAAGDPAGLIGTVETRVAGRATPAARTTPEAVDIQRLLRQMAGAGARMCALEVTSIGIESGRTEGITFDVAVFTNLTHDHLDHHGTMEEYYAAKAKLFTSPGPRAAVINVDDPYGRRLAGELPYIPLRFGMEPEADVVATDVVADSRGSVFRAVGCGLDLPLQVRLPGLFNVSNALAAACAALKMGISAEAIASGIAGLASVPGRFEPVDEGQGFLVVVDYAHTPDALANVLQAARGLSGGRVIAVFGCGGDRDRAKRPEMGEAAGRLADVAYATSDNPRSEDPAEILKQIEVGLVAAEGNYRIIQDRREAIGEAVHSARAGDVVVIAGKGHETGQTIGGTVFPFDDRLVAAEVLREMRP
ncbi:MAG TPA: UDP-N-acetylmuramoyl-L-alanyl-D-glutamate--2,6-diaminopimelate ligase [Actinomycetota bacterium]|nr:UDP-N-acetylmuramoyl-L-alanyl-D-glutamate--2,6-diaminopimelate ligase [Actinomycetota bacterium]